MNVTSRLVLAALILSVTVTGPAWSGPPSREDYARQLQVLQKLKTDLAEAETVAAKFALLTQLIKNETSPQIREQVLERAVQFPGPELDALLTTTLAGDADAGVRTRAATLLGHNGSEKSLAALARAAATDPTTECQRGCIVSKSSARRASLFALAELATRFPPLAEEAVEQLEKLAPPAKDAADPEGLIDARLQALYQVTRNEQLLQPFFTRLQNQDANVRVQGVVAFRFLRLKAVPPELAATLHDKDQGVRSWTALVLGEIKDPQTTPLLLTVAGNQKEEIGVRCNAINSLGRMKADAATLLRKLLKEPNPAIQANAAIAIYRITGEKTEAFPEGYHAD